MYATIFGEDKPITKVCRKCGDEKSIFDFPARTAYTKNDEKTERRNQCKSCMRKDNDVVRKLKKTITKPDSDHRCPICDRSREEVGSVNGWACDHNHATGQFRGWICDDCNGGLGKFKDNTESLQRAITYLTNNGVSGKLTLVGGQDE